MGLGMKVLNNIADLNIDHLTQKKQLCMLIVKYLQNLNVTFEMRIVESFVSAALCHPTVVSDDVATVFCDGSDCRRVKM